MKKELGQMFKEERMKRGLSITELAKFSGVDPKTISMIERGIRKKPNSNTLFKLYEVLDLPLTHAELYYLAGYNKREICEALDCKKFDYKFVIIVSGKGTIYEGSVDDADAYVRDQISDCLRMNDIIDGVEDMKFNPEPSVLVDFEEDSGI